MVTIEIAVGAAAIAIGTMMEVIVMETMYCLWSLDSITCHDVNTIMEYEIKLSEIKIGQTRVYARNHCNSEKRYLRLE